LPNCRAQAIASRGRAGDVSGQDDDIGIGLGPVEPGND
jgi:hypothetical protein